MTYALYGTGPIDDNPVCVLDKRFSCSSDAKKACEQLRRKAKALVAGVSHYEFVEAELFFGLVTQRQVKIVQPVELSDEDKHMYTWLSETIHVRKVSI